MNMTSTTNLHWFDNTEALSWSKLSDVCVSKGMRMCRYSEVCPNGDNTDPVGGLQSSSDAWCPILKDDGETAAYIHCGVHSSHHPCKLHSYDTSTSWQWNDEAANLKEKLSCCEDSRNTFVFSTTEVTHSSRTMTVTRQDGTQWRLTRQSDSRGPCKCGFTVTSIDHIYNDQGQYVVFKVEKISVFYRLKSPLSMSCTRISFITRRHHSNSSSTYLNINRRYFNFYKPVCENGAVVPDGNYMVTRYRSMHHYHTLAWKGQIKFWSGLNDGLNDGTVGDAHGRRSSGDASGQWNVNDYVEFVGLEGRCYDEAVPSTDANVSVLTSSNVQLPWEGEWRDLTDSYYGGTTITLKRNPSLSWTGVPSTHSYLVHSTFHFTSFDSNTGRIVLTEKGTNGDVYVSTIFTAGMMHLTHTMTVQTTSRTWTLTRQSKPRHMFYRFVGDGEQGTKRVIVNNNVFTNRAGHGNVAPREGCTNLTDTTNFTDRGVSTIVSSQSYTYNLSCGYQCDLVGWTRTTHDGFIRDTNGPAMAKVYGLTASRCYEYHLSVSSKSATFEYWINHLKKGTVRYDDNDDGVTLTGDVISDLSGRLDFVFQKIDQTSPVMYLENKLCDAQLNETTDSRTGATSSVIKCAERVLDECDTTLFAWRSNNNACYCVWNCDSSQLSDTPGLNVYHQVPDSYLSVAGLAIRPCGFVAFETTYDTTPPIVTVDRVANVTNSANVKLRLNLSEGTKYFTENDITTTGGQITHFMGYGSYYEAMFESNSQEGFKEVAVSSNMFEDMAGNENSNTKTIRWRLDQTRPTISIKSSQGRSDAFPRSLNQMTRVIFQASEPIVGNFDQSIVMYDKTQSTLSEFVQISDTAYEANLSSSANVTTLQIKSFRWSLPPWDGIPVADPMANPCAGYLYNASTMTLLGRVGFLDGHTSRAAACQLLCESHGDTFCYLQDESGPNRCHHCLNFPCYGLGTYNSYHEMSQQFVVKHSHSCKYS